MHLLSNFMYILACISRPTNFKSNNQSNVSKFGEKPISGKQCEFITCFCWIFICFAPKGILDQVTEFLATEYLIFLVFQEIRLVVRDLEQKAREILAILQNVHQTDGLKNGANAF